MLQQLRNLAPITRNLRNLHVTPVSQFLWEKDAKGGYKDDRKKPTTTQLVKSGLNELKEEIALWSQEVKERFENDPILLFRPGETDIAWRFNQKVINDWIITSDSDNNEGYSKCTLSLNRQGHAVFSGNLSTKVPKDGRVKRSGYCNMKSLPARKSFKRETYLNWQPYNMLVLKVRGDGRSYLLNIASKGYFDIMWNDVYHYALYTRGGPYWQVSRIPLSKFFLSSKGRVQDKQFPLNKSRVTSFGISVGDKINGPFNLEIDYIGLEYDPNHTEEFAYEMYKADSYIVGT